MIVHIGHFARHYIECFVEQSDIYRDWGDFIYEDNLFVGYCEQEDPMLFAFDL